MQGVDEVPATAGAGDGEVVLQLGSMLKVAMRFYT
jgi:hypothetical protein